MSRAVLNPRSTSQTVLFLKPSVLFLSVVKSPSQSMEFIQTDGNRSLEVLHAGCISLAD